MPTNDGVQLVNQRASRLVLSRPVSGPLYIRLSSQPLQPRQGSTAHAQGRASTPSTRPPPPSPRPPPPLSPGTTPHPSPRPTPHRARADLPPSPRPTRCRFQGRRGWQRCGTRRLASGLATAASRRRPRSGAARLRGCAPGAPGWTARTGWRQKKKNSWLPRKKKNI